MYRSWKFVVFTVLDPKEPRSAATQAPLCNWVASDNLSPKLVIFLALKGLRLKKLIYLVIHYDTSLIVNGMLGLGCQRND